ncbi:Uncharacterized protein FKW44_010825, partial [Caligus rogercresseyi]
SEGEDELKKRQLMELAIINGTYRDSNSKTSSPGLDSQTRYLTSAGTQQALQNMLNQQNALRNAAPLGGAPLILSPRLQVPTTLSSAVGGLLNGTSGDPRHLLLPTTRRDYSTLNTPPRLLHRTMLATRDSSHPYWRSTRTPQV